MLSSYKKSLSAIKEVTEYSETKYTMTLRGSHVDKPVQPPVIR